ncbi:CinA family protein, partial [Pseudoalteromonas sp. SYSU M81241]
DRTRADMGVAVVGVAGPTTQGDLPIGRVYIAIAEGESVQVHERNCPPYDRVGIQHFAVTYTLNTIFDALGVH